MVVIISSLKLLQSKTYILTSTTPKEIQRTETIMKLYYEQFNENENGEYEDIHPRGNA